MNTKNTQSQLILNKLTELEALKESINTKEKELINLLNSLNIKEDGILGKDVLEELNETKEDIEDKLESYLENREEGYFKLLGSLEFLQELRIQPIFGGGWLEITGYEQSTYIEQSYLDE